MGVRSGDGGKGRDGRPMRDESRCPGCHIGCDGREPQCGRGLRIRDERARTGKASLKRGPEFGRPGGPGGPGGFGGPGGPGPSLDQKLSFLLGVIVPRKVEPPRQDDKDAILSWMVRQEGALTYRIMPERAEVDPGALYGNLEQLLASGCIEDRYTERGRQFYWITDKGRDMVRRNEARRDEEMRRRFDALTDEEKQQLLALIEKLL